MPPQFALQAGSGRPIPLHSDAQFPCEQAQADHREVELHTRTVIADGLDHRMACSCGYLSGAYTDRLMAERVVCEVEDALAISQHRRRQMLSSHASMGVEATHV